MLTTAATTTPPRVERTGAVRFRGPLVCGRGPPRGAAAAVATEAAGSQLTRGTGDGSRGMRELGGRCAVGDPRYALAGGWATRGGCKIAMDAGRARRLGRSRIWRGTSAVVDARARRSRHGPDRGSGASVTPATRCRRCWSRASRAEPRFDSMHEVRARHERTVESRSAGRSARCSRNADLVYAGGHVAAATTGRWTRRGAGWRRQAACPSHAGLTGLLAGLRDRRERRPGSGQHACDEEALDAASATTTEAPHATVPTATRYSACMSRLPSVASLRRSTIARISLRHASQPPSAVRRSRAFRVGP